MDSRKQLLCYAVKTIPGKRAYRLEEPVRVSYCEVGGQEVGSTEQLHAPFLGELDIWMGQKPKMASVIPSGGWKGKLRWWILTGSAELGGSGSLLLFYVTSGPFPTDFA